MQAGTQESFQAGPAENWTCRTPKLKVIRPEVVGRAVAVPLFNSELSEARVPEPRFTSYDEFFTFYLREHTNPRNRLMHAAGTVLGLCTVIVPFAIGHPWYALLWPIVAYGFAWTGHFLIEGNKPATFGHPFWSFTADFRMLALMATGRLEERMKRDDEVLQRRSA